jgi:hypothetical protein
MRGYVCIPCPVRRNVAVILPLYYLGVRTCRRHYTQRASRGLYFDVVFLHCVNPNSTAIEVAALETSPQKSGNIDRVAISLTSNISRRVSRLRLPLGVAADSAVLMILGRHVLICARRLRIVDQKQSKPHHNRPARPTPTPNSHVLTSVTQSINLYSASNLSPRHVLLVPRQDIRAPRPHNREPRQRPSEGIHLRRPILVRPLPLSKSCNSLQECQPPLDDVRWPRERESVCYVGG